MRLMKTRLLGWQRRCCAEFDFRSDRACCSRLFFGNQGNRNLALKEEITDCLSFEFDGEISRHSNHSKIWNLVLKLVYTKADRGND